MSAHKSPIIKAICRPSYKNTVLPTMRIPSATVMQGIIKVVLEGYHRYFSVVKVKTVLIGGKRFLAARSGLNDLKVLQGLLQPERKNQSFQALLNSQGSPNQDIRTSHLALIRQ